jgi:hypothetical protein
MKARKSGKAVLNFRDGSYDPQDANDLVEGTMNYDYCDASILHWETTVDDTTIVVPATSGLIDEPDVDQFYDDVVAFASYRFLRIEDTLKTPRAYDIQITSSGSTSVTFKITSVIGNSIIYSPWSRKTFGSGSYEAMYDVENFCSAPHRNGPGLMAQFVNYNLRYPYYHYFLEISMGPGVTDDYHDPFAWSFICDGPNTSCISCTSCYCTSFTLADEYCRTQGQMNDDLDEAEYAFSPNSPFYWMPYGKNLVSITQMVPNRDCDVSSGSDRHDRWAFDYMAGTRYYEEHSRLFF